jgi:hypothetical protein
VTAPAAVGVRHALDAGPARWQAVGHGRGALVRGSTSSFTATARIAAGCADASAPPHRIVEREACRTGAPRAAACGPALRMIAALVGLLSHTAHAAGSEPPAHHGRNRTTEKHTPNYHLLWLRCARCARHLSRGMQDIFRPRPDAAPAQIRPPTVTPRPATPMKSSRVLALWPATTSCPSGQTKDPPMPTAPSPSSTQLRSFRITLRS